MTTSICAKWLRAAAAIAAIGLAGVMGAQEADPPVAVLDGYRALGAFNERLYLGTFSRPRGLAMDRERNEIWVADAGSSIMSVHGLDGIELYSFQSASKLIDPVRATVSPRGRLLVIEGDRSVVRVFNYRGEYLSDLELPGIGEKPIIGALAHAPDGLLYVGENRSSQVFVYDGEGKLKFEFGSHGTDEGQFMSICAIAIGPDGNVYVADQVALAVQVFDRQGNFLRGWGRHEMGGDHVSLPSGIALDSKGHVLLTDELRHQVKVFSNAGKLLMNVGGLGDGLGQFSFPTDVAVGNDDLIYVAERATSRVQVLELLYVSPE